jgi:hypothetical protein
MPVAAEHVPPRGYWAEDVREPFKDATTITLLERQEIAGGNARQLVTALVDA